jgi:hypothetical protein
MLKRVAQRILFTTGRQEENKDELLKSKCTIYLKLECILELMKVGKGRKLLGA